MNFNRRQTVQRFHNSLICNFQSFVDGFSLNEFCSHTACRYSSAAAECLKFHILNHLIFINIKINTHDIAAFRISYRTHAAGILYFSYISWMLEMIHNFFCIHFLFFSYF